MTTQQLTKQLKRIEHSLVEIRRRLLWEPPSSQQQRILKRTGGVWKITIDPVAWQKKNRKSRRLRTS